jgi:predicted RNase H-like HicB family nuclease
MGIYLADADFYPALVSRDGGQFEARFIDMPECHAFGATAIEAEVNAAKALRKLVAGLVRGGRKLPRPTIGCDGHRDRGYVAYIEAPAKDVPLAA